MRAATLLGDIHRVNDLLRFSARDRAGIVIPLEHNDVAGQLAGEGVGLEPQLPA